VKARRAARGLVTALLALLPGGLLGASIPLDLKLSVAVGHGVLRLVAVGDAIPVEESAVPAKIGGDDTFTELADLVDVADFALLGLPGPLRTPASLGSHFHVVSVAATGPTSAWSATVEASRRAGLIPIGFSGNGELAEATEMVRKNGRLIGFLGLTEGQPESHQLLQITPQTLPGILGSIRTLRRHVDLLVLTLRFAPAGGIPHPRLAHALCDAGADIIYGLGPVGLRPVEAHRAPDGRRSLIAYGLGGFGPGVTVGHPGDGVLLFVEARSFPSGPMEVSAYGYVPLRYSRGEKHHYIANIDRVIHDLRLEIAVPELPAELAAEIHADLDDFDRQGGRIRRLLGPDHVDLSQPSISHAASNPLSHGSGGLTGGQGAPAMHIPLCLTPEVKTRRPLTP
jgi:hypothetical protein